MTLRRMHATAMTAVGAALLGAVVACSPASDAAPTNPGGPGDPFIQCMTENGVPAPPDGPGGPAGQAAHPDGPPPSGAPQPGQGTPPPPPGVDQGVWNKALQACQTFAPLRPQG